ncbi:MAG: hypothetical protein WC223_02855 [Bacteroidales bacterium]
MNSQIQNININTSDKLTRFSEIVEYFKSKKNTVKISRSEKYLKYEQIVKDKEEIKP